MATWSHVTFCSSVAAAVRLATRRSILRRCGMDAGAAVWRVVLYPGVGCKVRAAALQWILVLRLFLILVVLRSEAGDELVGFVLVRFGVRAGALDLVEACTGACRRPMVAAAQVLRSLPLF